MIADISKLSGWLALIAAIAGPAVAWGVLSTKIDNLTARVKEQDEIIDEQKKEMADMNKRINKTDVQFASITTLLEQKIMPNLDDINEALKHQTDRFQKLIDNLIKNRENDKKGNS